MLDELLLQRYKFGYPDTFKNGDLVSFYKFEIHDSHPYELQKQLKYSWDLYFELKNTSLPIYGYTINPEAATFIRSCISKIEKIVGIN